MCFDFWFFWSLHRPWLPQISHCSVSPARVSWEQVAKEVSSTLKNTSCYVQINSSSNSDCVKLIQSEHWKGFKTWEISDWHNKILGTAVLACSCCWNLSCRELCLHWMIQRKIIGFWPCNEFCTGSFPFRQMGSISLAISCFIVVINGSF